MQITFTKILQSKTVSDPRWRWGNWPINLLSYIEGTAAELVYDGNEAVGRSDAELLE